jgi:hypothetical protein
LLHSKAQVADLEQKIADIQGKVKIDENAVPIAKE